MGILDLEYRKLINVNNAEQTEKKLEEQLSANGINFESDDGNIELKKINTLFASGNASIKVKDGAIKLEVKVMPSIAALICIALSIIFDCIGLFGECEIEHSKLQMLWRHTDESLPPRTIMVPPPRPIHLDARLYALCPEILSGRSTDNVAGSLC